MKEKKNYIIDNEKMIKDWDWGKNEILGLNPGQLTISSNKKAWWKCEKGHEWFTTIHRKRISKGCPYCSNRFVISGENDFETRFPSLMQEWDFEKNKKANPATINPGSEIKVWWICRKCGNNWTTSIKDRTLGRGCPECAKHHRAEKRHYNTLERKGHIPEYLIKEWHPTKNDNRNPLDFHGNENIKIWWICSKCKYEWQGSLRNRVNLNRNCPCCANRTVVKGINDLATTHPKLAKEWHPTKNGNIKPDSLTAGSGKKIWWTCKNGHEFMATVLHRKHGTGCPICISGRQTSFAEQAIFFYIKKVFPDAINRYKAPFLKNMELDIFIPSINYAIEYDGLAWHNEKTLEREKRKYKLCAAKNIKLIRLREKFADLGSDIADFQFGGVTNLYKPAILERLIYRLFEHFSIFVKMPEIDIDIKRDEVLINEYLQGVSKDSLFETHPELAKEWHPTKNGTLIPQKVTSKTNKKVWWKCENGHEWITSISKRTSGTNCPECFYEKNRKHHVSSKKIFQYGNNGIFIKEWDAINHASNELKINRSNIQMCAQGKRKTAGGFIWKYKKEN